MADVMNLFEQCTASGCECLRSDCGPHVLAFDDVDAVIGLVPFSLKCGARIRLHWHAMCAVCGRVFFSVWLKVRHFMRKQQGHGNLAAASLALVLHARGPLLTRCPTASHGWR